MLTFFLIVLSMCMVFQIVPDVLRSFEYSLHALNHGNSKRVNLDMVPEIHQVGQQLSHLLVEVR